MIVAGYVDSPASLEQAHAACLQAPVLGLDTEFERSTTYYPRPALIQLATAQGSWLLDPLAVDDLSPLAELLADASRTTVMHSALEDLEVLEIAIGQRPARLFDTQLAAALAGLRPGLGYHALVQEILGESVLKDQTRSNWLRRPLSEAQLRYARSDVEHLLALHEALTARLERLERLAWFQEESTRLNTRQEDEGGRRDYLRLVGRSSEDARARGRLLALCNWREAEARRRDRPRRHVLDDALLVDLASRRPESKHDLETLESWRNHRGRIGAEALLEAVAKAILADGQPEPPNLAAHRATLNAMREAVAEVARGLELDATVLASRRLLEKALIHVRICDGDGLPEEFRGWRAPLLEKPLMSCLDDG